MRAQRTLLMAAVVLVAAACASGGGPGPSARPSAAATSAPTPGATSQPAAAASPAARGLASPAADLPTRIVVGALDIDLPIVSGDLAVAGNPPDYPLCDVAQYLTSYRYPGRPGTTTWVYAHAREGMFLPLLEASERRDGGELIGLTVELYSDVARRYTYEITDVVRHAVDRGAARDVPDAAGRLVLQTSEGPRGTVPKLQVVARLVSSDAVDPIVAVPAPSPRACSVP